MEKSGHFYRYLRKSKNFTLEHVAENISSISLISKFEHDEVEISYVKLGSLLSKINVTLEEFETIINGCKLNRLKTLANNVRENYLTNNISEILKLKNNEMLMFKENGLKYHRLNSIAINSVYDDMIQKKTISKKDLNYLTEYLFSADVWTFYEIFLYINTLNSLNIQTVITLSKELVSKSSFFYKNSFYKKYIIETLINTCITLLEHNLTKEYTRFREIIGNTLISEEWLYIRAMVMYIDGIYNIKINNAVLGEEKINNAIKIFDCLNCQNMSKNLKKYLNIRCKL